MSVLVVLTVTPLVPVTESCTEPAAFVTSVVIIGSAELYTSAYSVT
jgi:hypothetical protein